MHVLGHEHPVVHLYTVLTYPFTQPVCIGGDILVGGKQRLTIVPALNEMDRNPDRAEPATPGQRTPPHSANSHHTRAPQSSRKQQNHQPPSRLKSQTPVSPLWHLTLTP